MELTEENVLKVLAKLGTSLAEIARSLKEAGIKGSRGCSAICPIANYLSMKFPGHRVDVGSVSGIRFYKESSSSDPYWHTTESLVLHIRTPPVIVAFIVGFDREGMFPELVS